MKKLLIVLSAAFVCCALQAQTKKTQIVCGVTDPYYPTNYKVDDIFIFDSLIEKITGDKDIDTKNYSELIPAIGKYFIGTPYVAHTLECEKEVLTINLRELDCTTFLENVVVISTLVKKSEANFETYLQRIAQFRYRKGEVDGYASRIHYFSDWIVTNEKRGFVKNITKKIGGEPYAKTINFMTQNREKYPRLKDEKTFEEIKKSEDNLNKHKHYYIPKSKVAEIEKNIHSGDLIAITCTTEGLDIAHVGLAVEKNGRIHFMHAPMSGEKVMISAEPLHDYLAKRKGNTGIMVARMIY
ncbi:MAG: DUF1460 domain-containing protein [Prevotellaceae bacterium]|jgi:hypothetical protein|nr:DUF1460 domain-containing protein [Prevotellaceae bacterium]